MEPHSHGFASRSPGEFEGDATGHRFELRQEQGCQTGR